MNSIKKYLSIAAFSLLVLGLPAIASAQYGNGGYYPNGGYGNGGYGNNGYYGNIRSTVQNLKMQAQNFERLTDRNGRYGNNGGGWGRYDNNDLEDLADRFAKATDRLEDKYGRGRNLDNSADEARRVLDIASQIDQSMYRSRSDYAAQNVWDQIRNDLQIVANTYGYNYYNNGNRNNRNNRGSRNNGNWRDRLPIRLPF